jgi:hypothetical protein
MRLGRSECARSGATVSCESRRRAGRARLIPSDDEEVLLFERPFDTPIVGGVFFVAIDGAIAVEVVDKPADPALG